MRKLKTNSLRAFLFVCFGFLITTFALADSQYDPPSKPGRPEASNVRVDGCDLKYLAPLNDGGSAIIGYIIQCREIGNSNWKRINKDLIPGLECEVSNAKEGEVALFRIIAVNKAGLGEPSEVSDMVTFRNPF